ncbi:TRAP transporter small permease subunit [Bradyrhizobium sp.]|uniref:TRAP transporter small permease subunit n=1 Tax=Bradyrhizobium sp. TaxID=376 RepID=UPI0027323E5C|nr:TRAP transporter small permease subunit [Bradyrhizobium sp.]MDP3694141.1 TRAP transporter small permease subunit [Bradyrhizobium sp.]
MLAAKISDGIDWFIDWIGRTISWLALAVAVVMGTNVFLRYGFSIGEIWAQELEWHLLVQLTLIGMSYALRHGEHVRVDVLFSQFSDRNRHLVDIISAVMAMLFSLFVMWLSIGFVGQSWSIGEGSSNPGGIGALYLMKAMVPLGFALLFLQALSQGLRSGIALGAVR